MVLWSGPEGFGAKVGFATCVLPSMALTMLVRRACSSISMSAGVKLSIHTRWLSVWPTMVIHAKNGARRVFALCLAANARRMGQAAVGVSALSMRRGASLVGTTQMLLMSLVFVPGVPKVAVVAVLQASSKSFSAGTTTRSIWNHDRSTKYDGGVFPWNASP